MPMPPTDLLGVVLAGGRSRRMGRDKALLAFDGGTLLRRQVRLLEPLCARVVVSGAYAGFDCIADARPDAGPLAGLLAAGAVWRGAVLVLPVDMPLMSAEALAELAQAAQATHFDGHPLPAFFPDAAALGAAADSLLADDDHSVRALHRKLGSRTLPVHDSAVLANANTPADWRRLTSPL